jgi:hypothetical protein
MKALMVLLVRRNTLGNQWRTLWANSSTKVLQMAQVELGKGEQTLVQECPRLDIEQINYGACPSTVLDAAQAGITSRRGGRRENTVPRSLVL